MQHMSGRHILELGVGSERVCAVRSWLLHHDRRNVELPSMPVAEQYASAIRGGDVLLLLRGGIRG